ncbi:MAG: dTMP kinase [Planctomycetales bacterium]|nr:dTMP kinase [Planctomycetales bacterium]
MFFSFDGIDGSGKSTQIQLLQGWLMTHGHQVEIYRDPGSTELGEKVRTILLAKSDMPIGGVAELMLYMTARAQLVDQLIRPALEAGKMVIVDRYLLASLAYQGHAGSNSIQSVHQVGQVATQGVLPRLTFLLDIDPDTAWARLNRERDRIEERGKAYLTKVREGFLMEAKKQSDRIVVIDASQEVNQIHEQIVAAARNVLLAENRLPTEGAKR